MYASSRRSTLISGLVHVAVIVILLLMSGGVVPTPSWEPEHISLVLPSDLVKYEVVATDHGGGGGGNKDSLPPTKGSPPKPSLHPFVPPTAKVENQQPILSMEQAVLADPSIQIPRDLPVIGDPNGMIGVRSDGPGGPVGIGKNGKGGVGSGPGPGVGDGPGPGVGGIRDTVTQPELIWKSEPAYTEEARKVKLQGTVLLRIVVDEHGRAEDVVITQGLGLGLDERAVEAVKQWKFKPGMRGSKPVPTVALIQVSFRLL
jgi:periplasmic protein TonB